MCAPPSIPHLVALLYFGLLCGCAPSQTSEPPVEPLRVMTVDGWLEVGEMGFTLPHEHVLVDFAGAAVASPERYDRDEVVQVVLPHLRALSAQGASTLFEATPAYLGRDPLLMRRLAAESGLHLITNTGYYAARSYQHLPPHAFVETADELAARWVAEWRDGIEGSGVRPGFIKIGVDRGPLSDTTRTLVRAAARTHLATGLTIAAHTGTAVPAREELALLAEEGVDPSAWIWVHAQAEADSLEWVRAAKSGAWISFDGLGPDQVADYVAKLNLMRSEGLLGHVLVSHDAGWYHVGEPNGGEFRSFETLAGQLLPALRRAGFTAEEIDQVVVRNPAEAFAVRIRSVGR